MLAIAEKATIRYLLGETPDQMESNDPAESLKAEPQQADPKKAPSKEKEQAAGTKAQNLKRKKVALATALADTSGNEEAHAASSNKVDSSVTIKARMAGKGKGEKTASSTPFSESSDEEDAPSSLAIKPDSSVTIKARMAGKGKGEKAATGVSVSEVSVKEDSPPSPTSKGDESDTVIAKKAGKRKRGKRTTPNSPTEISDKEDDPPSPTSKLEDSVTNEAEEAKEVQNAGDGAGADTSLNTGQRANAETETTARKDAATELPKDIGLEKVTEVIGSQEEDEDPSFKHAVTILDARIREATGTVQGCNEALFTARAEQDEAAGDRDLHLANKQAIKEITSAQTIARAEVQSLKDSRMRVLNLHVDRSGNPRFKQDLEQEMSRWGEVLMNSPNQLQSVKHTSDLAASPSITGTPKRPATDFPDTAGNAPKKQKVKIDALYLAHFSPTNVQANTPSPDPSSGGRNVSGEKLGI